MKPRLLDLFCGAGGCSVGYARAGFDVVGVDLAPQPNYPFEFHQADVMDVARLTGGWVALDADGTYIELGEFDAVHASPPCQHYAPVTKWRGSQGDHPDLYEPTLARLRSAGVPWVIENVPGAPFTPDVVLCGSMFGLPVRRHRWFIGEPSLSPFVAPCHHRRSDLAFDHGGTGGTETEYRAAMGCDWMTVRESRNAIPPAYTEFIGQHLMSEVGAAA